MTDRVFPLLLLAASALCIPWSGQAQDPPPDPRAWEASVRYDYDRLSEGRTDWHRWTISLKRDVAGGTIMGSAVRQQRFGTWDTGGAIDAWWDLWEGAYGHLRLGLGPDARIRPQRSVQADLHQSFGAWEVSGQYDWQRYRNDTVHLFGPGLARYVGSWYVRTRTTIAPRPETWAVAQRVGARRFYASAPSSYVDVEAGAGRGVELVGSDSEILVTQTFFASVRVRHFFTSRLGLTASLRYSDDDVFQRTGGSLGLIGRW